MAFTERSRAAREALLAAARRSFAEQGYERTTVRSVAADAGVDPSMVNRYFGSKRDLFAATLDFDTLRIDLRLPDLRAVPPGERGTRLARHFLALWDEEPTSAILAVLLRSATTNALAAARIQIVFTDQVLLAVRSLDAEEAEMRAGSLAAYILGTALCRYVLALPPLFTATGDEVVAVMGPVIQGILEGERT